MVEIDETLRLNIETSGAGKTVGELRQEVKNLNAEILKVEKGSARYNELISQLGRARGEFRDVREEVMALNPENRAQAFANMGSAIAGGFAAAQAAAALLGTESEDVGKALLKVQAAMAFAQGIQQISQLGKAFGILNTIMLANPLVAIAAGIAALTIGIISLIPEIETTEEQEKKLNDELERSTVELTKAAQATDEYGKSKGRINSLFEKSLSFQIRDAENTLQIAKAKKTSEEELLLLEKNVIEKKIENAQLLRKQLSGSDKQKAEELKQQIKDLHADLEILNINHEQKKKEEAEKIEKERIKNSGEAWMAELEFEEKLDANKTQAWIDNRAKETQASGEAWLADMAAREKADEDYDKSFDHRSKQREKEKRDEKAKRDFIVQQSASLFGSVATLLEASKNRELAAANGNEIKQENIRKEYFEKQKKVQIALALISTYQGAQAAFTSTAASPITALFPAAPYIAAGLAIVAGLANVDAIRSQTYQGGGGGAQPAAAQPATASVSSTVGTIPSAPAPAPTQAVATGTTTTSDGQFVGFKGQPIVKAYVVESDITESQLRVQKIKDAAIFP